MEVLHLKWDRSTDPEEVLDGDFNLPQHLVCSTATQAASERVNRLVTYDINRRMRPSASQAVSQAFPHTVALLYSLSVRGRNMMQLASQSVRQFV